MDNTILRAVATVMLRYYISVDKTIQILYESGLSRDEIIGLELFNPIDVEIAVERYLNERP